MLERGLAYELEGAAQLDYRPTGLSARWTFRYQDMLLVDKLLSGRRALVVEDEMLILMMIEDMLADLGCKSVTSAATVDRVLTLIEAQAFDVALLDMNLGGNDSHAVAAALSARGVPFAYSTDNTGQNFGDGNLGRLVLKKPFRFEDLVAILTRLELAPIE